MTWGPGANLSNNFAHNSDSMETYCNLITGHQITQNFAHAMTAYM